MDEHQKKLLFWGVIIFIVICAISGLLMLVLQPKQGTPTTVATSEGERPLSVGGENPRLPMIDNLSTLIDNGLTSSAVSAFRRHVEDYFINKTTDYKPKILLEITSSTYRQKIQENGSISYEFDMVVKNQPSSPIHVRLDSDYSKSLTTELTRDGKSVYKNTAEI